MDEERGVRETDGLLVGLMVTSLAATLLPWQLRWIFALSVLVVSLGSPSP